MFEELQNQIKRKQVDNFQGQTYHNTNDLTHSVDQEVQEDEDRRLNEQRLSELLITDKLIHEENEKVIAELRRENSEKDHEIARL